ncbi:MAG TPA: tetratricopeptide repeat protein [Candidatus Binataceae bacterium]|nr:tetratricopeptide repeat protein [Candidatus Binataceae bacterium]
MQPANPETVSGNFNHANFSNGKVTSTFFRRGAKFMVRTDGPDGALHDYEIKFTFGVSPLQQYLIALPGGRLQALGIAWDSRPRARGGQRWFFLYPGQKITPSDPLHWTGIDQNWNHMCADCHSTNVRKNYDLKSRSYTTSYAEVDVACEACHGPGSDHIAWARRKGDWKNFGPNRGLTIALDEHAKSEWTTDPGTGNPRRRQPRDSEREIQMCAQCHSRRGEIHEDYVHGQPVEDDYRVSLLEEALYFPDGQIKGEDYEYGSFIQSRMFHAGVTCSDCHEPHSLKLRAEGNRLCTNCHSAPKYDSAGHHFHKTGSPGSRCVECHMPARTYMVIDPRRDHSIRVPRPDLSVELGTPNACNQCHGNRPAQWAADTVRKWYGHSPSGFQRFAHTLSAGTQGAPGAQAALNALVKDGDQPAIARATALTLLAAYAPSPTDTAIRAGLNDTSPLVRAATARALANSDLRASVPGLGGLFSDPVRAVRLEAAEAAAGVPEDGLSASFRAELNHAVGEYIAAQNLNADRPESHLNLGLLYAKEGKPDRAEVEYKIALSLDPTFTPAAVNLADLYRQTGKDAEGEEVLKNLLTHSPNDPSAIHTLGLLMVRQKRLEKALPLLADASRLAPDNARYSYVYAIALSDTGQSAKAIEVLQAIVKAHPYDRDSLAALMSLSEQSQQPVQALGYAQRLNQLMPGDPELAEAIGRLKQQIAVAHPEGQ